MARKVQIILDDDHDCGETSRTVTFGFLAALTPLLGSVRLRTRCTGGERSC